MPGSLKFKIATEDWEFAQIHHLNYQTFVEEIPQHAANPDHALVDKFHRENTYIICLDRGQVVGMIAVRDRRPFSLDAKLNNLDAYLPPDHAEPGMPVEIDIFGEWIMGQVAEEPLFDPDGERVRSRG